MRTSTDSAPVIRPFSLIVNLGITTAPLVTSLPSGPYNPPITPEFRKVVAILHPVSPSFASVPVTSPVKVISLSDENLSAK